MDGMYDRDHVKAVLTRSGLPDDERDEILDEIQFPIDLPSLQRILARFDITHVALMDQMGGSP